MAGLVRDADKFIIRLPDGLRDLIKDHAKQNRRTMNAEVVFHLERIYCATNASRSAGATVTGLGA